MNLGQLIDELGKADKDVVIPNGFKNPHSWRGSYSALAFEPCESIKVSEMLKEAKSAVGSIYEGWKGGRFKMGNHTDVHIAFAGQIGEPITKPSLDHMLYCHSGKIIEKPYQKNSELYLACKGLLESLEKHPDTKIPLTVALAVVEIKGAVQEIEK